LENKLEKLLKEKKKEILVKWEDSILSSYEPDTFKIFKTQKNQFANPVGHKVRIGLNELFDVLCDTSDEEVLTPDLEELIKLRAVQEFSASDAVSFVFNLKKIVREELKKKDVASFYNEWLAFDARIDAAVLVIFDMFMRSRDQVHRVRLNEFKKGRDAYTQGACPSAFVRRNQKKKDE
jgi:hypothetical protein